MYPVMKKFFPLPPLLAAAGAIVALPFDLSAAGFLAVTAGLGAVICLDYTHRYRGLRLPKQTRRSVVAVRTHVFRAPPLRVETNRLAA